MEGRRQSGSGLREDAEFLDGHGSDGDGSIVSYVDRYDTSRTVATSIRGVYSSLVSANPRFIQWVRTSFIASAV